jgi:hypothetical protein
MAGFGGTSHHGAGAAVALGSGVGGELIRPEILARQDGFGRWRAASDDRFGAIEVLTVRPILATPTAEQAIRSRAARMNELGAAEVLPVRGVKRDASGVHIVSAAVSGVPLTAVLSALASGRLTLADEAVLDLAAAIVRAAAALHMRAGTLGHGAMTPAHVILTRQGLVVLTGASFGSALEAMQMNREHHWRAFGVALPPAASWPRFDQRADVTQLGALVLSLLVRRPLATEEYPRAVGDLVAGAGPRGGAGSGVRMWLQQALQLHPRSTFASASEAEQPLVDAIGAAIGRPASAQSIQTMVGLMCGGSKADTEPRVAAADPRRAHQAVGAVLPKLRTT